jgi:hypothetical protein
MENAAVRIGGDEQHVVVTDHNESESVRSCHEVTSHGATEAVWFGVEIEFSVRRDRLSDYGDGGQKAHNGSHSAIIAECRPDDCMAILMPGLWSSFRRKRGYLPSFA